MSIYGHGYMSNYYNESKLQNIINETDYAINYIDSICNGINFLQESGIEIVNEGEGWNNFKEKMKKIWDGILNAIKSLIEVIGNFFKKIGEGIKNLFNKKNREIAKKADDKVKNKEASGVTIKQVTNESSNSNNISNKSNSTSNSNNSDTTSSNSSATETKSDKIEITILDMTGAYEDDNNGSGKGYEAVIKEINNVTTKYIALSKQRNDCFSKTMNIKYGSDEYNKLMDQSNKYGEEINNLLKGIYGIKLHLSDKKEIKFDSFNKAEEWLEKRINELKEAGDNLQVFLKKLGSSIAVSKMSYTARAEKLNSDIENKKDDESVTKGIFQEKQKDTLKNEKEDIKAAQEVFKDLNKCWTYIKTAITSYTNFANIVKSRSYKIAAMNSINN